MVEIDKKVCIGCGKCVANCVSMCLALRDRKAEYGGKCIHCGHCVAICPVGAVAIPEYDMEDVQELAHSSAVPVDSLLRTIKSRRSIRRYTGAKIEPVKLANIAQAGRYTATAVNRQGNQFIFVQDHLEALKQSVWGSVEKAVRDGVEEARPLEGLVKLRADKGVDYLFRNAPAVLYIATENLWDAGLAAQNMELAATTQGLGVLYNGFLTRATRLSAQAQALLRLEGTPLAVCMLMGYPDITFVRTAPRRKANVLWL